MIIGRVGQTSCCISKRPASVSQSLFQCRCYRLLLRWRSLKPLGKMETKPTIRNIMSWPMREHRAAELFQFDCTGCSAMQDLLFVAASQDCGNAGCNFYVFRNLGSSSYEYLTAVFLDHGAFAFLKTKHHGLNDILSYHRWSATDGSLYRLEFDGTNYREIGTPDRRSRFTPESVNQTSLSPDDLK
jgi:hypothetical protein